MEIIRDKQGVRIVSTKRDIKEYKKDWEQAIDALWWEDIYYMFESGYYMVDTNKPAIYYSVASGYNLDMEHEIKTLLENLEKSDNYSLELIELDIYDYEMLAHEDWVNDEYIKDVAHMRYKELKKNE